MHGVTDFDTLIPLMLRCPHLKSLVAEIDPNFACPTFDPTEFMHSGIKLFNHYLGTQEKKC